MGFHGFHNGGAAQFFGNGNQLFGVFDQIFQMQLSALIVELHRVNQAAQAAQQFDRERKPFIFADGFTREGVLDDVTQLFV
jgi:hypothetical protein